LDGIKFHFQSNQIDLNDAKTQESISEILLFLSEKNIPVLIHLNITDLTNGSGMAKQFIKNFLCNHNKQTIIFAHCGGAGGLYKATLDVLEEFDIFFKTSEFSVNKDIYFELSGTILDQKYPGKISSSELKKIISKMGHKHFLFGSDFPLRTGKKYLELLKEELDLDAEMLESIKTRNIFEKN
jgi:predicted TIM-barrel fold metal-dependent hydrolase